MWIEVLKIGVPLVGGFGSGVLLMVFKERRDKKGQLEAEQRQILTELQTTLTEASRMPRPQMTFVRLNMENPPKPDTRYGDTFAKLRNLLARITDQKLLHRIRNVHIVSAPDWLTGGKPLREALGLEEPEARAAVLDDAHRVVSAVLRGEPLPLPDETGVVARFEEASRVLAATDR